MKPIKVELPNCSKCKKVLSPIFTTEKDENDKSKPEFLILYGKCDNCKVITISNIIDTKNIL